MDIKIDFSIIIPALNEESLIEDTFNNAYLSIPINKKFEIILINDCSSDNTGKIMENIASTFDCVSVIHNEVNINLGGSYKIGVENAKGDYVIMIPGDNSFSSSSINEILEASSEADIVVQVHKNLKEFRSFKRTIISQLFTLIVNITFRLNISYYNGIVLHKRSKLNSILLNSNSFFYQAEALVKLIKNGSSYVERSVLVMDHKNDHKSSALSLKNIYSVIKDFLLLIQSVRNEKY